MNRSQGPHTLCLDLWYRGWSNLLIFNEKLLTAFHSHTAGKINVTTFNRFKKLHIIASRKKSLLLSMGSQGNIYKNNYNFKNCLNVLLGT